MPKMPNMYDLKEPELKALIANLASGIWTVGSATLSTLAAIEAGAALAAKQAVSLVTRLGIWTLPITAAQLGYSARQEIDDAKARADFTAYVILRGSWFTAVDRHRKSFPQTKIIDDSQYNKLFVSDNPHFATAYANIGTISKLGWPRVRQEALERLVPGSTVLPQTGSWDDFIWSRFNEFVSRYQQALMILEVAVSTDSPTRDWPYQPIKFFP
jgi:hypothetical protein